ncbi:MAG: hypothetical protein QOF93_991 [Verrucomicrobiota bacterium]|jgi:hypothetical protein
MKLLTGFSIAAVAIGIISNAFAGPTPASSGPSPSGLGLPASGTPGLGTTSGAKPEGTPNENNTDERDDTLYRGKTSESENPMAREEGRLHFKTRPKEKIQEVDSLKNLPSSKSDPKFQGNLLNSGVTSIEHVTTKAEETRDAADEEDPRFKTKRLVFTADKKDESKQAQTDSTPSPTPSPTASPAAKNSAKQ